MAAPLIAAGVVAAGASAAGAAASASKKGFRPGFQWGQSGDRKRDVNGNLMAGDVDGYNADKYEYGGKAGAADARAGMYDGLAHGAALREGAQADYAVANADRAQAQQARAQQAQALDLQRQAALGQAPSVAQLQMVAGMDQAMRGQEAQRASAPRLASAAFHSGLSRIGLLSGVATIEGANALTRTLYSARSAARPRVIWVIAALVAP